MSRELTREEKAAIRSLVVKWCANYDRECGCLPLDCECYMLGKCWTGAYCRYFREAVLPLDPALEAALLAEGPRPVQRKPTAASRGNICGKSGDGVLTIRPIKTRLYQGFPGPVSGRAVSEYGLPRFGPDAVNIYAVGLWDNLSRSARFLRRCYSGKQSKLCDPAVCFVRQWPGLCAGGKFQGP